MPWDFLGKHTFLYTAYIHSSALKWHRWLKSIAMEDKHLHLKMLSVKFLPLSSGLSMLTHCGLLTLYDDIGLGQHWLR